MDEVNFDDPKCVATCHAEGCGNADIPITVPAVADLVICGPCGTPIYDIVPVPQESHP